jgi:hypothetical protein
LLQKWLAVFDTTVTFVVTLVALLTSTPMTLPKELFGRVALLLVISLSLLTVNYFVNLLVLLLAIAAVCHHTQHYEQVAEGLEQSKLFLPDLYRNHLPFRPYSLRVPHFATKITCLYSTCMLCQLSERETEP